MNFDYKTAGVDLEKAETVVNKIGKLAKTTHREGVIGSIGLFGGFFEIPQGFKQPVMVSSIDGVGTKIKIACALNKYTGIGVDLVNHCVNDIMCCGADPLYFLDYLSLGKIEESAVEQVATGLASACKENYCALIGGETAEMPDIYQQGEFDIAGTIVGIVERSKIIDGSKVRAGDKLIGLPGTGLHTNGYSLARHIVERSTGAGYHQHYESLGMTIGDALLATHKSYQKAIQIARDHASLHAISHVTGGGIIGNTKRLLKKDLGIKINWDSWEVPEIFKLLQSQGNVATEEMRQVFNMGIGLVFVVAEDGCDAFMKQLSSRGEEPLLIGGIY